MLTYSKKEFNHFQNWLKINFFRDCYTVIQLPKTSEQQSAESIRLISKVRNKKNH